MALHYSNCEGDSLFTNYGTLKLHLLFSLKEKPPFRGGFPVIPSAETDRRRNYRVP